MDGLTITILAISATWFVLSFIFMLMIDEMYFSILSGIILTIILWNVSLALGIIALILTVIGVLLNISKLND